MKRLIILIAALMLITTGCHKDKVEPMHSIVTYYGNGGLTENGESSVKDVELVGGSKDVYLRANTFTRNGYNFKCWNTKADGLGISYWNGSSVTLYPNSDLHLYAVWMDDETIFMCNGSKQLSSGKTYHFYDSGGPNENYNNNEDYTYTFKAPSGKRVKIVFNDFDVDYSAFETDYLTINGTRYYNSYGSNGPGTQYSSGSDFIVQWHSSGSYNHSGWSAIVTVVD